MDVEVGRDEVAAVYAPMGMAKARDVWRGREEEEEEEVRPMRGGGGAMDEEREEDEEEGGGYAVIWAMLTKCGLLPVGTGVEEAGRTRLC